jgi:hypothetical protein
LLFCTFTVLGFSKGAVWTGVLFEDYREVERGEGVYANLMCIAGSYHHGLNVVSSEL